MRIRPYLFLAALACCSPFVVACGSGTDVASSADELDSARRHHCSSNSQCHNGQQCIGGICKTPAPTGCKSNSDCHNGQICKSGQCQTPPPGYCQADSDCPSGEVCTNNQCVTPPPPPPPPGSCQTNADCSNGQVCTNGTCTTPPPPPPPPPSGGCNTMDDCTGGGLCESHQCVAMACLNRATGKTGLRAQFTVTSYHGMIHGRNGDHEQLYAHISNLLWAHDSSIVDTSAQVQLDMNVKSSIDPTGLPQEIPLQPGQVFEAEGEYIDAAAAGGNVPVVHFTHSTCGYVTINGSTYQ